MKVLLTGGSGFLGSALALHLQRQGHDVALLLRPHSSLARLQGRDFDISRCASDADVVDCVRRARPDAVVHAACCQGRGGETLVELSDTNVRLGLLMLQGLSTASKPTVFLNIGTALPSAVNSY